MSQSQTRTEIIAELTKIAASAMEKGEDGLKAVEAACPGIPTEVAVEAWMNAEDAKTKAWWEAIERTIDGEIVRRAITGEAV